VIPIVTVINHTTRMIMSKIMIKITNAIKVRGILASNCTVHVKKAVSRALSRFAVDYMQFSGAGAVPAFIMGSFCSFTLNGILS